MDFLLSKQSINNFLGQCCSVRVQYHNIMSYANRQNRRFFCFDFVLDSTILVIYFLATHDRLSPIENYYVQLSHGHTLLFSIYDGHNKHDPILYVPAECFAPTGRCFYYVPVLSLRSSFLWLNAILNSSFLWPNGILNNDEDVCTVCKEDFLFSFSTNPSSLLFCSTFIIWRVIICLKIKYQYCS